MMTINEFKGEFAFLSNFYPSIIEFNGITYPTVEHAYQALKTTDNDQRKKIASLAFPGQAKKAGQYLKVRNDWDDIRLGFMEELLNTKFKIPELRDQLIATGNQELQEGNWWKDKFWGIYLKDNEGENKLGKLLMKIRTNYTGVTSWRDCKT